MTEGNRTTADSTAETTLMGRLGITITEASAQRVVGTMPVQGNTQPLGILHGGASAALAETLGSFGAALHAGTGRAVGLELSITHHAAVRTGHVTGVAEAVHLGRTTATYLVAISDQDGRPVASARMTCLLLTSGSTPPSAGPA